MSDKLREKFAPYFSEMIEEGPLLRPGSSSESQLRMPHPMEQWLAATATPQRGREVITLGAYLFTHLSPCAKELWRLTENASRQRHVGRQSWWRLKPIAAGIKGMWPRFKVTGWKSLVVLVILLRASTNLEAPWKWVIFPPPPLYLMTHSRIGIQSIIQQNGTGSQAFPLQRAPIQSSSTKAL